MLSIKYRKAKLLMIILEKIFNYLALFIYGIFKFILMIIESLITLRNCVDLIGGIIYQPIIFLTAFLILQPILKNIEAVYYNPQESLFPYIVFIITLLIIIVLVINALIELMYYIFHKQERYNIIFSIQKSFYNYSLIVISLVAFWVSYDKSIEISANLELLIIGAFFFLCVVITDLYNFLLHSQNKVGTLYKDIIQKKKELF